MMVRNLCGRTIAARATFGSFAALPAGPDGFAGLGNGLVAISSGLASFVPLKTALEIAGNSPDKGRSPMEGTVRAGEPLALQFSSFASKTDFSDLPITVVDHAKVLIPDLLGCIIGASHIASSQIMAKTVLGFGGPAQSKVIGCLTKTSAPWAALINGTTGHAFDMDDDHR